MGKTKIKTIGDEELEQAEKEAAKKKREEKRAREAAESIVPDQPQETEAQTASAPSEEVEETETTNDKKAKKPKEKFAKKKSRSANYNSKMVMIDKNKNYSLKEGLELLQKVRMAKFDEAVELHINTVTDGISGQVKLPHGTGKEVKVAIADDTVLAQVEKGKIEFDILIATPDMMPRLAKVAKVLGPKGLMPNPKNGTISANPQEAAKAFQGGQMHFKTEAKLPVMHMVVGRISFDTPQLEENIQTALSKVGKDKIRKVVLKSTMSPAIRLQV